MVVDYLHQGDILKIEKIKHPVLVASKDFFNSSGEIIGWKRTDDKRRKKASLRTSGYRHPDRVPADKRDCSHRTGAFRDRDSGEADEYPFCGSR